MGFSGAKGVQALIWLGTISERVLKHLQNETWCIQKFPAEEKKNVNIKTNIMFSHIALPPCLEHFFQESYI